MFDKSLCIKNIFTIIYIGSKELSSIVKYNIRTFLLERAQQKNQHGCFFNNPAERQLCLRLCLSCLLACCDLRRCTRKCVRGGFGDYFPECFLVEPRTPCDKIT